MTWKRVNCGACDGTGKRYCSHAQREAHFLSPEKKGVCIPPDCDTCHGTGTIVKDV